MIHHEMVITQTLHRNMQTFLEFIYIKIFLKSEVIFIFHVNPITLIPALRQHYTILSTRLVFFMRL